MAFGKRITEEEKRRMIMYRKNKFTIKDIATLMGVSLNTVHKNVRGVAEVKEPSRKDERALEAEKISKEHRRLQEKKLRELEKERGKHIEELKERFWYCV